MKLRNGLRLLMRHLATKRAGVSIAVRSRSHAGRDTRSDALGPEPKGSLSHEKIQPNSQSPAARLTQALAEIGISMRNRDTGADGSVLVYDRTGRLLGRVERHRIRPILFSVHGAGDGPETVVFADRYCEVPDCDCRVFAGRGLGLCSSCRHNAEDHANFLAPISITTSQEA